MLEIEQQREFKGVWIPKEVWLDERLSALDKCIFVEIDSLDNEETGCYCSNEYLAEFCQCSITKVSTAIKKLIDYDYIYLESFNGRQRVLKRQTFKKCKAELQKVKANNIDNNKNNNNNKENKTKENCQIIFDHWNSKNIRTCRSLTDKVVKAISKRLKDFDVRKIKVIINRYNAVIKDETYFFKMKWTLEEFMKQNNAFLDFDDNGSKWVNFMEQRNITQENQKISTNGYAQQEKTQKEKDNEYLQDIYKKLGY